MYSKQILQLGALAGGLLIIGCDQGVSSGPGTSVGGATGNLGGASSTSTTSSTSSAGGNTSATSGGASQTSSSSSTSSSSTGGTSQTGSSAATGGKTSAGGTSGVGGTKATGGTGTKASGGSNAAGGSAASMGGTNADTSSTTVGGTSSSGGTSAASGCKGDPTQLINADGWNCDLDADIKLQGAVYPFGDGSSCPYGEGLPSDNICTTGKCCLSGTTVVDKTYAKWGCGIGMELNSSGGDDAVKSEYTGPVKCFDITLTGSSGGNEVRIGFTQAADTTGQVSPFVSVAAFTNGWNGTVCFTDAECASWSVKDGTCTKAAGTAGTPYDMQIQVSAGSTTTSVGAYDVCVSSIVPVMDSGNTQTTNSCSSVTGKGTITDPYGTATVTCNSKAYMVQNNVWGASAAQTITYGEGTKFKVTNQTGSNSGDAPVSYPSLFIGANNGRSTASSGLPLAVKSISTTGIKTSWSWKSNGATGSYNATYDVWFSTGSGGDPSSASPTGGYLMVWFHKPSVDQPIGESKASTKLANQNWNVWYGQNSGNGKPCVSYVAQTDVASMTFNLGEFIQDAVTRGYIQDTWYLTNVYSGFEIWSGGVGLETTDFAVAVP